MTQAVKRRSPRSPAAKTRSAVKDPARQGLPSVNILSPWAFERMAVSRLRRSFVLGALVLVLLAGGLWWVQQVRTDQAGQVLVVEQAETTRLTARASELAPVRAFVTGVEQQQRMVQETMADEIYFSRVLEGVQSATPAGASVESIAVTLAPQPVALEPGGTAPPERSALPAVSPCPGPDPFNTRPVVGCITLSGSAADRAHVGHFVIALGADKLFIEPFISTTTTADGEAVTFSGSVGLSEKVYSRRYADLDELTGGGR
jgi:Tfp pilus assembly protein PilN